MFSKITNPENKEKVSIFSPQGKSLLKNYIKTLNEIDSTTTNVTTGGSNWGSVQPSTTESTQSVEQQVGGGWGFSVNDEEHHNDEEQ